MDPGALAQTIADQFVTVWNAPVPFLGAAIVLWFVLRWFIREQFETRLANSASMLANADSTIAMLKERLDRREASEAISIAASQATHEDAPKAHVGFIPKVRPKLSEAVATDATPLQLMKLVVDRTLIQAKPLLDQYVGKAMTVSGALKDVLAYDPGRALLTMTADGFLILCHFGSRDDRLMAVRPDETVTVRGILDGVSNLGIELSECEFV